MFWLFLAVAVVATGPIGKAIAARLSGRAGPAGVRKEELLELEQRLEERVIELESRLDYTERLLEQQRRGQGLPPLA